MLHNQLLLHFTLSNLGDHCLVFVQHYSKIGSWNILNLYILHVKNICQAISTKKARTVCINIIYNA